MKQTIPGLLEDIDRSLDSILEASYLQEANLYQVIEWIQRAIVANRDVEKLLRKRSFIDFNKLMFGNNLINNIVDLEVALNNMKVNATIKDQLLRAYRDYKKWHYDGNGVINADTAKFNARNLSITGDL